MKTRDISLSKLAQSHLESYTQVPMAGLGGKRFERVVVAFKLAGRDLLPRMYVN